MVILIIYNIHYHHAMKLVTVRVIYQENATFVIKYDK